jgi:hypothetical protein
MSEAWEQSPASGRENGFEVTKDLSGEIKSPGPVRHTNDTAMSQLVSKRAVQMALQDRRPVQPDVFASMIKLAKLPMEEKLRYISKYTAAMTQMQAEKCLCILQRALQDIEPGSETVTVLDYKMDFSVHARSITYSRSSNGSAGDTDAQRDFADARRAMARGKAFGWITSVGPGFQITNPSRTICALLDLEYDDLNGSFLLADPLLGKLETMLGNFGEWVLIIGMLTSTALNGWRSDPSYPESAARVSDFFRWLSQYVTANYKDVAEQVERAPAELVDGDSSRNDLRRCLAAATGRAEWPPYNINRNNTMRLHVVNHPDLSGGIARFEKTATPFRSGGQVLAYEVSWSAEDLDEVATRLMRSVLARLGLVDGTGTE